MCVIASYDIKIAIYYYFFLLLQEKNLAIPIDTPSSLLFILNFVAPFCSILYCWVRGLLRKAVSSAVTFLSIAHEKKSLW